MDLKVKLPNGTVIATLNYRLVKMKNVSDENIGKLKLSHIKLYSVKEEMKKTDDPVELRKLALKVQDIEYTQQDLWGFERNSNYHYWWKVPKCICGNMDNNDSYGTKYRHIDLSCPVHGKLEVEKTSLWNKIKGWFK